MDQAGQYVAGPARRFPIGAEIVPGQGVHVRIWAPKCSKLGVVFGHDGEQRLPLRAEQGGYFSGLIPDARAGQRYGFQASDWDRAYPDPVSRFQPAGPHGLSEVIDPHLFDWRDGDWQGIHLHGQVLYEMHIGTFTPEGTFASAERELPELAELGVTTIEVMPVADFPGTFGWGYDGVCLFAPTRLYGRPDDFRSFVNAAHRLGMGVILDVVYNHLGPDGNYLKMFSEDYFTSRYANEWGEAINFDGENSGPVREFFVSNAQYWIREFHLDGFRLDATQQLYDRSTEHILKALTRKAREAAGERSILVTAEDERQRALQVRSVKAGGYGLDALWNDDFHHSARVAVTGWKEAYYTDYTGQPQELLSALKWGFLYQGQYYTWQKQVRGTPALDLPPEAFVVFIENHDQVANSGQGLRLHQLCSPEIYRAISAMLLLSQGTALLFQGQEFASSKPFLYFADHQGELGRQVSKGRAEFLSQFPSMASPAARQSLTDPTRRETFERCRLDLSERKTHAAVYAMYRDLLHLRRSDPVFRVQAKGTLDGAVLGPQCFVLRYFGKDGDDRLLFISLGVDLRLDPAPEPLLAPPSGRTWNVLWSSDDFECGGRERPPVMTDRIWHIPGHAALVLAAKRVSS